MIGQGMRKLTFVCLWLYVICVFGYFLLIILVYTCLYDYDYMLLLLGKGLCMHGHRVYVIFVLAFSYECMYSLLGYPNRGFDAKE
ncbi:hypothetical protein VIGAN_01192500 [Vigna angularis var. angularis]|uniref:Uncharacterized protein n=1 Tax=Vigna angularis var. angularis TaxID=157739 RepID=A0A0S3R152_PHAAN|nr:hypothetical protein VIGAN_01192500 [Vigna angularis var. angularis]